MKIFAKTLLRPSKTMLACVLALCVTLSLTPVPNVSDAYASELTTTSLATANDYAYDLSQCDVSRYANYTYPYTGKPVTPWTLEQSYKDADGVLPEYRDYWTFGIRGFYWDSPNKDDCPVTIEYKDNVKPGTATCTVTAKPGNDYCTGQAVIKFKIKAEFPDVSLGVDNGKAKATLGKAHFYKVAWPAPSVLFQCGKGYLYRYKAADESTAKKNLVSYTTTKDSVFRDAKSLGNKSVYGKSSTGYAAKVIKVSAKKLLKKGKLAFSLPKPTVRGVYENHKLIKTSTFGYEKYKAKDFKLKCKYRSLSHSYTGVRGVKGKVYDLRTKAGFKQYLNDNTFYAPYDYMRTIGSISNNKLVLKTSDYLTRNCHNVARGTFVLDLRYDVSVGNKAIAKAMKEEGYSTSQVGNAKVVVKIV